uniref:Uncharacterized protein n=1 Tax=viral metagenome TaxID=1070528 RepID=A0A6C0J8M1_9ZZZZ
MEIPTVKSTGPFGFNDRQVYNVEAIRIDYRACSLKKVIEEKLRKVFNGVLYSFRVDHHPKGVNERSMFYPYRTHMEVVGKKMFLRLLDSILEDFKQNILEHDKKEEVFNPNILEHKEKDTFAIRIYVRHIKTIHWTEITLKINKHSS